MMDYNQLEALVIEWAGEKGILEKGTPDRQALKTLEECGELVQAVAKNDKEVIADALGDILVTIIIQAEMQEMSLTGCLEAAYEIIAKRKGQMVNGQFLKDA